MRGQILKSNKNGSKQYGLNLQIIEENCNPKVVNTSKILLAKIGSEITFNPSIFDIYNSLGWRLVHYDLLVVCAAVEYADRFCVRRPSQWSRLFNIEIPVREITIWQSAQVQKHLIDVLRHLTGDIWNLSFVKSQSVSAGNTLQRSFSFDAEKSFVIAYSDGIDSLCVSGLYDINDSAVRVRVSNHKVSPKKYNQLFDVLFFDVQASADGSFRESSMRSRGFKFASITAIAAHLSNINRIIVPESGQGALGPVLSPLHNIYADYRNHPTFFRKMERFIYALINYRVSYDQPRLWNSKGQTISDFLIFSKKPSHIVSNTRSCWQSRWNVQPKEKKKRRQCGLCAACLLRRMSMHAAKIDEPADTYTFSDLSVTKYENAVQFEKVRITNTMLEYGLAGARHLQYLANMSELPDSSLKQYAFEISEAIDLSEQATLEKLRVLLKQHSEEWNAFVYAQGENSFIKNWLVGGRHEQPE